MFDKQQEPPIRDGLSPPLQAVFDRTCDKAAESFNSIQSAIIQRLGSDYRMGLDIQSGQIAFAKAGTTTPVLELPILIAGTELAVNPDDPTFVWPWAHEMFGLPPFPVRTEFANELQQIGGGAEGIEEFVTPVLRFSSENNLRLFYLAIQGWADLDAFFCPQLGQAKIVVFARIDKTKLWLI